MKRIITQLLTIALPVFAGALTSYAQEQLKHEPCTYINEKGRFFVNKNLGVYLWLSTSPDENAPKHRLFSETSPQYSNPFYFDTEGWNTIRTPSQVDTATKKVIMPLQNIIFEVYSDSKSPQTAIDLGKVPLYTTTGGILYCGKGLQVSLTAKDETSGVKTLYVSVNGQPFQEYSQPVALNEQKEYTIKFYSVDNVGNPEETKEKKVVADLTGPSSEVVFEGDKFENVLSPRSIIKLNSTDDLSGLDAIYYKIDDGAERKYYNYISLSTLGEGMHTLTYYGVDKVKNEETAKNYEFFLDKSAPIVVDEVLGNQFVVNGKAFSSGRTKFKITAVDNKAGVKEIYYSLDGGINYQLYDKPFYLPSKAGSLRITFYAIDNVNNKGGANKESKRTSATYVDLTGPALSHQYTGPVFITRDTVFINKDTKIILKGTDIESGMNKIDYRIDSGSEVPYDQPFHIETEGFHHVDYVGYDNVENSNRSDFFLVVDNTAPEVYTRFSIVPLKTKTIEGKAYESYPAHVVLFLSATDTKVGYSKIYYSINGTAERLYVSPISGFTKGTKYTIKTRSYDYLGNNQEQVFEFTTED